MRANHSRSPNTDWATSKRTLTANRRIEIGTEITFDCRLEIASDDIKHHPPEWA